MTIIEALTAAARAGLVPELDAARHLILTTDGRRSDPVVKAALLSHREQLEAVLHLREVHRGLGLTEQDVLFVEEAMLSGRIHEIRIAVRAPDGAPA